MLPLVCWVVMVPSALFQEGADGTSTFAVSEDSDVAGGMLSCAMVVVRSRGVGRDDSWSRGTEVGGSVPAL